MLVLIGVSLCIPTQQFFTCQMCVNPNVMCLVNAKHECTCFFTASSKFVCFILGRFPRSLSTSGGLKQLEKLFKDRQP